MKHAKRPQKPRDISLINQQKKPPIGPIRWAAFKNQLPKKRRQSSAPKWRESSCHKKEENLERAAGIEPASLAWKAKVLPLHNARPVNSSHISYCSERQEREMKHLGQLRNLCCVYTQDGLAPLGCTQNLLLGVKHKQGFAVDLVIVDQVLRCVRHQPRL